MDVTDMTSMESPEHSNDEYEDDPDESQQALWDAQKGSKTGSVPSSPMEEASSHGQSLKPSTPMQKRRRVTRACDECRRKKIKCDGKQPCTHCTVYSYECTYDQPSNRRRNPAPQYIEALESRLQRAEMILRNVLPGVDLDDPKYDARGIDQIIESAKSSARTVKPQVKTEDDARLQSMIEQTGSLDLDDQGRWDFHGHSSGFEFMRRIKSQFGESFIIDPRIPSMKNRPFAHVLESPTSATSSPYDMSNASAIDLPKKEIAIELCRNTLDDCCALMRPIHRPTFFKRLHKIYDIDPDHYTNAERAFLPQLYVVLAIGCLFSRTENEHTMLDMKGYQEAIDQGYQYFNAAKQLVDITDCRDLITLQTVTFMVIFLQSTAKLSTCYSILGIALRACCRLGLHRDVAANFNPIEREERKRLFWIVRKMDMYVGAMLGLPEMLSDDDVDQQLPVEIDDDYITEDGILPVPSHAFPLLKATNAHTRLTQILKKVVRHVYPIKLPGIEQTGKGYSISHARIREIEGDLQAWMDQLPMELRPSENANRELSRVQQLLRMSYAHVQMMMYRPFIHYVSHACESRSIDKRSFACAAACVSVARNIVHITSEMKKRGLLVGAYWFVMYTTYFAIISLVFFVLENPESPTGQEILKDAQEGRDTLASLAKRSLAADRCTHSLTSLFKDLPEKLQERRTSLSAPPASNPKKRNQAVAGLGSLHNHQSTPSAVPSRVSKEIIAGIGRSRTFPHDFSINPSKRASVPNLSHVTPVGWEEKPLSPRSSTPGMMSFSGTNSTQSPALDYGVNFGHSDMPDISDLKGVMFPGDNPFAYPTRPISSLEEAQYMTPTPQGNGPGRLKEQDIYNTAGNMDVNLPRPSLSFEDVNIPMYSSNLVPQYAPPPETQFAGPLGSDRGFVIPPVEEPAAMGALQGAPDDYWSQISTNSLKTGLTPGGVNLDELFGGDGWGTVWNESGYARQI